MTAIVELKNATKIVNTGIEEEKVILNDVSLDIFEHDFITILGGNGAGKSTLFNVIAGTLPLTSGSIYILGENVTSYSPEKRAKYLSRVFQDPKMGTAPRMTVAENLLIAKFRGEKRRLVPRRLSHYRKEFQETIDKIGNGLEKHLDTPIEFLSGGNQQKVLLSRWLLTRPQFLILDEPTRGIDVGAHAEIIRLIETLCADGLALLVISSELEELVGYADRVIIMRDRKQVAEIPLAELSVPAIMNAIAA